MSLKSISLRDFVIVREMDLDLSDGFTVLTGETGAGKSILIGALQLALGARSDANIVREGTGRCEISAEFDSPDQLAQIISAAAQVPIADFPDLQSTDENLVNPARWVLS